MEYDVMFAPAAGRNPNLRTVEGYDRVHAALKAWRAAGRSQFPNVRIIDVHRGAFLFDGTPVTVMQIG